MWMLETSIEGLFCLEIPVICKPRFSGTSCLNVCRSDPHFMLWYYRWENFVSYLISTQCLSFANQNKSFLSLQTRRLSFSVEHFTLLLNQIFSLYVFCERIFSKKHPIWFKGSVIIEKQYLIIWIARSSHSQVLKNFLNGGELCKTHFLGIWKNILD